jgi:hypothetical protein
MKIIINTCKLVKYIFSNLKQNQAWLIYPQKLSNHRHLMLK